MVGTFLKVYMELGSYFLFLQEQIKDNIIKELLGLRDGVLHFRHYLLGIKFKVHTDHSSLLWLMTQTEVVGQRQRWLVVLSEFDMTEIAHIAGEKNVVADGLSRYPYPAQVSPAKS